MKRARLSAALIASLCILTAPVQAAETKRIAVSTVVEVPQLLETKAGVLKGLAEKGFVEGKNLSVDYQSANGNTATQQQIAQNSWARHPTSSSRSRRRPRRPWRRRRRKSRSSLRP